MTVSVGLSAGSRMSLMLVQQQLAALKDKLANRRPALIAATHAAADQWSANYTSEGGNVGGWAALSARTLQERAATGYAPGPILRRSGTLQTAAIADFSSAGDGFTHTTYNPYRSGQAAEVFSQLAIEDGSVDAASVARLTLGGFPATTNQKGSSRVPARPIWYVDGAVSGSIRNATEMWLSEITKEFRL